MHLSLLCSEQIEAIQGEEDLVDVEVTLKVTLCDEESGLEN